MSNDTTSAQTTIEIAAQEILVLNLRNTHALEKQTIAVLQGQLTLLEDYPDLHTRVTEHIVESRDQARRLEAGLEACGSSASMFKDALLSVMGLGQSSVQGFGDDAVLKAVVADIMTEHLEIATYRTLLHLADLAGKPELRPRLEESLREEEAMATWLEDNLESITGRTVELRAAEVQHADPVVQEESEPDEEPAPTLWQTLEAAKDPDGKPQTRPQTETDIKHKTPSSSPSSQALRSSEHHGSADDASQQSNRPTNRPVDS